MCESDVVGQPKRLVNQFLGCCRGLLTAAPGTFLQFHAKCIQVPTPLQYGHCVLPCVDLPYQAGLTTEPRSTARVLGLARSKCVPEREDQLLPGLHASVHVL